MQHMRYGYTLAGIIHNPGGSHFTATVPHPCQPGHWLLFDGMQPSTDAPLGQKCSLSSALKTLVRGTRLVYTLDADSCPYSTAMANMQSPFTTQLWRSVLNGSEPRLQEVARCIRGMQTQARPSHFLCPRLCQPWAHLSIPELQGSLRLSGVELMAFVEVCIHYGALHRYKSRDMHTGRESFMYLISPNFTAIMEHC